MIKLPKKIKDILKTLSDAGFEGYAVGPCVRDSILGKKPVDWDISTNATLEDLNNLFPDGVTVSQKLGVVRLYDENDEETIVTDVATFRKKSLKTEEGSVPQFVSKIEEDLERRDFTVDAIADSGMRFVDDHGGKSDIMAKLIRTVGDPGELFREDPFKIIKAYRLVSDLGFDMTQPVYEAIMACRDGLESVKPSRIGKEFLQIIGGEYAGKALNMIVDMGVLRYILGPEVADNLSGHEKSELMELCQNIEKTKPIPERRIGVLMSMLSKKKALSAIDRLGYEGDLKVHLEDVAKDLPEFHFCQQPQTLKKFCYEHAPMERSDYLLQLQKAMRIVFGYDIETKIKSKMYLFGEFEKNGDPIFVEDLAVDGNDLMEAGITETPEETEAMLRMLIERLHIEPRKNTRRELLELAKRYKKNKLLAYLRGVSWIH
ncbi:MAG: CCA tRNA nucleotidyltransferase [Firmicutes bacterium]|nr:CCA tRNA nucleotidyltransferase [Bacillota bacterium]